MKLIKIHRLYKNISSGDFLKLMYHYRIYKIIEYFENKKIKPLFLYKLTIKNTVQNNKLIWNNYNWNQAGYEWGDQKMVDSVFENIIKKYSTKFNSILEIGPGAGRWSGKLIEICENLILVDQSETCINILKQKFSDNKKVKCILNDGKSLIFIDSDSIDFIWSFDVFVHIDEITTESYISEFARVLKRNGVAIIHHPHKGGKARGWRSNISSERFREILSHYNLNLISQFSSWGKTKQFNLQRHNDIISVFTKK